MKTIAPLVLIGLLCTAMTASAQNVVRVGKEWAQPADFPNSLTRFDVAVNCPLPDGICSGTLAGVNVDGYRWASAPEVVELFESYGAPTLPGDGELEVTEVDSTWAPAVMADFNSVSQNLELVEGWTRTEALQGQLIQGIWDQAPGLRDQAFAFSSRTQDNLVSTVWLWRPPTAPPPAGTSVPIPTLSAYGLILAALALLFVGVRRLRSTPES